MLADALKELLTKANPDILFDVPLSDYTTFRIGGGADALWLAKSAEDTRTALLFAKENHLPVLVMGNGSNMLIRDGGVRGLVLKVAESMRGVRTGEDCIDAESGIMLMQLSQLAADASLDGLAFASGIPGTLGGAVTMNAGAYGGEMSHCVLEIAALDREGNSYRLAGDELAFGYRRSAVLDRDLIVTNVRMRLQTGDRAEILETMRRNNASRRAKQPVQLPSAGSVFKRPPGHFAGHLIETSGLKGKAIGGAQVSPLHAGFIVNTGNATARDVEALIGYIQKTVEDKHGVHLEPEIHILGEEG